MKNVSNQNKKINGMKAKIVLCFLLFSNNLAVFAQGSPSKPQAPSVFSNSLFIGMLSMIILLLVVIWALGNVLQTAAKYKIDMEKRKKLNASSIGLKALLLLFIMGLASNSLFAQVMRQVPVSGPNLYGGLVGFTFYFMLSLIVLELIVVGMLYFSVKQLLEVNEAEKSEAFQNESKQIKQPSLFEKFNASVAIDKETDILLDHNYDGIRELDNDLPPWWKYGFYFTIVVGLIYFLNFHVFHTGKLPLAEYTEQMEIAKAAKSKSAATLDESAIDLLKDEASLTAGKSIFLMNCAACHGKNAEGVVGPNLTDDYWIHGGGIKDLFKTIKYGWPEKGMKSWQQDFSAKQMQEVASYIKSLRGTNPPNGKDKQGDLYVEEGKKDSIIAIPKDTTKIVQ